MVIGSLSLGAGIRLLGYFFERLNNGAQTQNAR